MPQLRRLAQASAASLVLLWLLALLTAAVPSSNAYPTQDFYATAPLTTTLYLPSSSNPRPNC